MGKMMMINKRRVSLGVSGTHYPGEVVYVDVHTDLIACVSFIGGGGEAKAEDTVNSNVTINVFSIASGHLYERFLRYIGVPLLASSIY